MGDMPWSSAACSSSASPAVKRRRPARSRRSSACAWGRASYTKSLFRTQGRALREGRAFGMRMRGDRKLQSARIKIERVAELTSEKLQRRTESGGKRIAKNEAVQMRGVDTVGAGR